jgi:hypothetical protein
MKTGVNDNHTAQQLTVFLRKIIDTLERIPHFPEEETPEVVTTSVLTTAGAYTVRMNLSKASLDAMETLFYYYTIALRNPGRFSDERIVRRGVAGMTESCLQVAKAMRALPFLRRCVDFLLRGQATAEDLAVVLQRVGTLFEFLPSFGFEPGTYDRDEDKLLS